MLMVLEYLREYRTYFHISKIYGVSEGYIYQLILWVEDTLIRSKLFSLPERQALLKSNFDYEVILSWYEWNPNATSAKKQSNSYSGKDGEKATVMV